MFRGEPSTTVDSGGFTFAYRHLAWVCKDYKEVGAPMAEHMKTKRVEVSGMLKPRIARRNQEGDKGSSQGNGHSFHD